MTREEAIKAVKQATDIFVHAVISKRSDGNDGHTEIFRIAKEDALAAMQEICDPEYGANIDVSEEGRKVVIGTDGGEAALLANLTRASEFSHNDNNNGNF